MLISKLNTKFSVDGMNAGFCWEIWSKAYGAGLTHNSIFNPSLVR